MLTLFKKLLLPIYKWLDRIIPITRLYLLGKRFPCKIVVGASKVYQKGWLPTEIHFLNLINQNDWKKYFLTNSISAILAEHVWEHLTLLEGEVAARNCFNYLRSKGYLRIAVPDGNHPSKDYIEYVKPGGFGPGAHDHKVLYTIQSLSHLLIKVGFEIRLLEYYDECGSFHFHDWDEKDGIIYRSKRYDERNVNGELKYTSIIIDAIKP